MASSPRRLVFGAPSDWVHILTEMGRQVAVVLYVVAMVAVIVSVVLAFFRNRFWERLTVNIAIVLVFAAFYLRLLTCPCTRRGIAPKHFIRWWVTAPSFSRETFFAGLAPTCKAAGCLS